jgi:hypothetical protein
MDDPRTNRPAAFTWIKMTVVIACVMLPACLIIDPPIAKAKARITPLDCVDNLKNIGLTWRICSTDNSGLFPRQAAATNRFAFGPTSYATSPGAALPPAQGVAAVFALVTNELSTPKILLCPYDTRRFQLKTDLFTFLMAPAQATVCDRAIRYFIGTSANEGAPQSTLGGDRNLAGGPFSTDTNTPPSQVALRIRGRRPPTPPR